MISGDPKISHGWIYWSWLHSPPFQTHLLSDYYSSTLLSQSTSGPARRVLPVLLHQVMHDSFPSGHSSSVTGVFCKKTISVRAWSRRFCDGLLSENIWYQLPDDPANNPIRKDKITSFARSEFISILQSNGFDHKMGKGHGYTYNSPKSQYQTPMRRTEKFNWLSSPPNRHPNSIYEQQGWNLTSRHSAAMLKSHIMTSVIISYVPCIMVRCAKSYCWIRFADDMRRFWIEPSMNTLITLKQPNRIDKI